MRYLVTICFLFSVHLAVAQQDSAYLFCYFKNNGRDGLHLAWSNDGLHWQALFNDSAVLTPEAGHDKLMRDPCITRGGDGLYHLVWTISWTERGIGHATSSDLIHWSPQQFIPLMTGTGALNVWAPEISYEPGSRQYYLYWASTVPGRFPETDSTGDGRNNHRIYYTTTKDFRRFSREKVLYDKGFNVIDASLYPYAGGYVLFVKDETRRPVARKHLLISTARKIEGPYSAPSAPITGPYWAEGPTALYINGRWIVYFDRYRDHRYGAVTSADLQHWTDISDQVSFPKGIRHGTAFKVPRHMLQALQAQEAASKDIIK
jgi:hypothetical protein